MSESGGFVKVAVEPAPGGLSEQLVPVTTVTV